MSPNSLYFVVSSVFVVVIGYDVYNWLRDRTIKSPGIRIRRLKSKINAAVLILGFTMLIVSILLHVNILRYSRPIPFSEIDTITLYDFKGYRKPDETVGGQKEVAFIVTSIEWEKTDNGVELQAVFHPARSYVYNERIADRFLIKHELYHFRITEVFARKCRQALSQREQVPSDETIDELLTINGRLEDDMQHRYDDDSYHGYIMTQQVRWEESVDSLLNLLEGHKTPIVTYE
jgi:hypothetical protein